MPIVFADLSNSTPVDERTSIMATFQACSQIGLLIGPVFNLLLREFDFKIGDFSVNKLTAPGLFMALVGIILEILFITIYFNLGTLYNKQKLVESLQHSYVGEHVDRSAIVEYYNAEGSQSYHSINSDAETEYERAEIADSLDDCLPIVHENMERTAELKLDGPLRSPRNFKKRHYKQAAIAGGSQDSNEIMEDAEDFMCTACESSENTQDSRTRGSPSLKGDFRYANSSNNTEDKTRSSSSIMESIYNQSSVNTSLQLSQRLQPYKDEFLRDEIVVLLGLSFVAYFAQSSLETITTPLTQLFYNFDDFANSLFFLAAGTEILLSFLLIKLLTRKIEDRVLILIGSLLMTFSLAWYLAVIPKFSHGDWGSLPYFVFGIFTNLMGISFLAACCISLYSKLISKANQGIGHGIRRTILSAGMIFGPLWGGAAIHMPVILFSIPLAIISCFTVLFCISFRRLRVIRQCGEGPSARTNNSYFSSSRNINSTDEERSPLLPGTR